MSKPNIQKLQAECDAFNAINAVGADVFVKLDAVDVPFRTRTRSEAQILSGHSAVIWLEGVSGCYLLDRVTPAGSGECYIVNLSHTHRRDRYITIWRPNDRGYCWALSRAGKYPIDDVMQRLGYYNGGCTNVAVLCEVLDAVAVAPIPGHHDNDAGPCVENTRANWNLILSNVIAQPKYPPQPEFKGAPKVRETA